MAYDLLGKNFTPPDVHAKVTGKAKYSEDFRVDGMVFLKVLSSPMPHARVTSIDASAALAMPGVHGVLTADEVTNDPPEPARDDSHQRAAVRRPPDSRRRCRYRRARERRARADQGHVRGAAVHRRSVAEPVPRRTERAHERQRREPGRRSAGPSSGRRKTSRPSAKAQLPMGAPVTEWSFGDVDAGLAAAKARARRDVRDGGSRPSLDGVAQRARVLAERQVLLVRLDAEPELPDSRASHELVGVEPADLIYVSEFCGGGFGSKGGDYPLMVHPGADGEEDRPTRDDARVAARGVLHGLGAGGLPRAA